MNKMSRMSFGEVKDSYVANISRLRNPIVVLLLVFGILNLGIQYGQRFPQDLKTISLRTCLFTFVMQLAGTIIIAILSVAVFTVVGRLRQDGYPFWLQFILFLASVGLFLFGALLIGVTFSGLVYQKFSTLHSSAFMNSDDFRRSGYQTIIAVAMLVITCCTRWRPGQNITSAPPRRKEVTGNARAELAHIGKSVRRQ